MTDTTMTSGSKMSPQTKRKLALGGGAAGLIAALSILGAQLTSSSNSHASGPSNSHHASGGATVTVSAPAPTLTAPDWVHQVDRSLGSLHTDMSRVMDKLDRLETTMDKIVDALIEQKQANIR